MNLGLYIKRAITYILQGIPSQYITAQISYLAPHQSLAGKNIIITGGGRGLGLAMAKKFIAEGAVVLIAGRNEETLKKSSTEIGCKYLKLDVQEVESFHEFFNKAEKLMGSINCLVNNAGISLHEESILSVSQEQFESQINTNFRGPFFWQKSL